MKRGTYECFPLQGNRSFLVAEPLLAVGFPQCPPEDIITPHVRVLKLESFPDGSAYADSNARSRKRIGPCCRHQTAKH